MSRLRPIAVIAAAAALSACSTVERVSHMLGTTNTANAHAEPQEGRVSILSSDQALTPDPSLAGHTIAVPPASPLRSVLSLVHAAATSVTAIATDFLSGSMPLPS